MVKSYWFNTKIHTNIAHHYNTMVNAWCDIVVTRKLIISLACRISQLYSANISSGFSSNSEAICLLKQIYSRTKQLKILTKSSRDK